MVATIKIITFAVAGDTVERCRAALKGTPAVNIAPFQPMDAGLVQTRLPGIKESVIDKTVDHGGDNIVTGHPRGRLCGTWRSRRNSEARF